MLRIERVGLRAAVAIVVGAVIGLAVWLGGCAPELKPLFNRYDGRRIGSSPELQMAWDRDLAGCEGVRASTFASGAADPAARRLAAHHAFIGCMADRGYRFDGMVAAR